MERPRAEGSCSCYVDPNAKGTGLGQPPNPGACIATCLRRFLQTASIPLDKLNNSDGSENWGYICPNLLAHVQDDREFWSMYWCNRKFCGVDHENQAEIDPAVKNINASCGDLGIHSFRDPGPMPPNFTCDSSSENDSCLVDLNQLGSSPPGFINQLSTPAAFSAAAVTTSTTLSPISTASTSTTSTSTGTLSTTTYTSSVSGSSSSSSPTTLNGAVPTAGRENSLQGSPSIHKSNLSARERIAIAICSVVGLVLIVAAVLFCLHRRRQRKPRALRRALKSRWNLKGDGSDLPPRGSPTPLISPVHSGQFSPPLRLRDRRLLPSLLRPRGDRSPSPPLTPLTPAYNASHPSVVFPSSPICAPTTNKLVPRYERTPRVHGAGSVGSLPQIPGHTNIMAGRGGMGPGSTNNTDTVSRASHSSYGGVSAVSTAQSSLRNVEVPVVHIVGTPPGSPTRPPRPHDTPLEIPDLVRPDSPPPPPPPRSINAPSLPPPPTPVSPISPTASILSGRLGGHHYYHEPVSGSSTWNSSPRGFVLSSSAASRDFVDVMAASSTSGGGDYYGPPQRGSWGSWKAEGEENNNTSNNNHYYRRGANGDDIGTQSSSIGIASGGGGGGGEYGGSSSSTRRSDAVVSPPPPPFGPGVRTWRSNSAAQTILHEEDLPPAPGGMI